MCSLFSFVYNFSRNFSIVINLVPLERYSKAKYSALVFVFKKRGKSEEKPKNEDEKNQLLIQACYELHFYIVGKLKDRRAQKYILIFYGELLLLTCDIRGNVREIDSFFCFRVFSKQTKSGGSITLCDTHINIFFR